MNKIRVLLIEDNRLLREGLSSMLDFVTDIKVVDASGSKHDILAKVKALKPHVVLFGIELRSEDSRLLVQNLGRKFPDPRIVITGLDPEQRDVVDLVQAGVSGFILKEATFEEVVKTVRSVATGASVLPPALTGPLFSQVFHGAAAAGGKKKVTGMMRLTRREREVTELIAEGLSNKEVAQKLNIATHTVKSHVHNILEKLTFHSRVQIATYARPSGALKVSRARSR